MSGKRQGRTFGFRGYLKYPEGPRDGFGRMSGVKVPEKRYRLPDPFHALPDRRQGFIFRQPALFDPEYDEFPCPEPGPFPGAREGGRILP